MYNDEFEFGQFHLSRRKRLLTAAGEPVNLGARAFDLLLRLVEEAGTVVSKHELLSSAWPGLVVEEANLHVQIAALRKALGVEQMYILNVPGRGYCFASEVVRAVELVKDVEAAAEPPAASAARDLAQRSKNLPLQTSTFIGREAELLQLRGMLSNSQLVTLVGAGGIGKTRLSLQAASEVVQEFIDGVWLVELAALTDGIQVPEAIAAVFDVQLSSSNNVVEELVGRLMRRRMLLILDNCEHVVEATAAVAAALLRRSQTISILASSRTPLGIIGEQVFPVPPLGVPPADVAHSADIALSAASVRLFVDRARLVRPGFVLDDEVAMPVAKICRRLDGLALAIELAAARVRLMKPAQLLAALDDRFNLLTSGGRERLERQQTLRATIEWSFNLLTDAEFIALRRLSVFGGGFTLAAAAAVIASEPIAPYMVTSLVASLLDKSLITEEVSNADTRFRLVESTRELAREKLMESGEANMLRYALSKHMVEVFGEARESWPDTDAQDWRARYESEIENLRPALDWAFGTQCNRSIAVALAAKLHYLFIEGLLPRRDAGLVARMALAMCGPDTPEIDKAWLNFMIAHNTNDTSVAIEAGHKSVTQFLDAGNDVRAAYAIALVASNYALAGDLVAACAKVREAASVLPALPANRLRAALLGTCAGVLQEGNNQDPEAFRLGRQYYNEALILAERFRDYRYIIVIKLNLIMSLTKASEYAASLDASAPLVADCRARMDFYLLGHALAHMTLCKMHLGDVAGARETGREACLVLADQQVWHPAVDCAIALAWVAAVSDQVGTALQLAAFADHWCASNGVHIDDAGQLDRTKLANALKNAMASCNLTAADCTRFTAEGAGMTPEMALALAVGV
jgi:predicted ATPase/DNA-binding winged helix-turn-helix (wHTH) protein